MSKAQGKATLKTALKVDDMGYLVSLDETTWIGNRYWATQVGENARAFLASFNVPLQPARFEVNGSVTLTDGDVPSVSTIGPVFALPDPVRELTAATFNGDPITITRTGYTYAPYTDPDGNVVYLDTRYVAAVLGEIGDLVTVCQSEPGRPAHFVGTKGRGVVMPIRA